MSTRRTLLQRVLIGVIALGFAIGAITHALDFWWFGWAPYLFGPPLLNLFWNALVGLDAAVLVLLALGWTRCALALALVVMIGDVSANSYAWSVLGLHEFAPALVAQSGFLGLLLGSAGFLWPHGAARAGHDRAPDPAAAPRLPGAAGDGACAVP